MLTEKKMYTSDQYVLIVQSYNGTSSGIHNTYPTTMFVSPMPILLNEPVREKTNNLGFRPRPTQTGMYSHRRWLEAGNFGFRK